MCSAKHFDAHNISANHARHRDSFTYSKLYTMRPMMSVFARSQVHYPKIFGAFIVTGRLKMQDWKMQDKNRRTQKWTTKSVSVALDYVLHLTEESTINNELQRIICRKNTRKHQLTSCVMERVCMRHRVTRSSQKLHPCVTAVVELAHTETRRV